ncbi:MAG: hypothetical protein ACLUO4_00790 [Christensenellales bacterium]
MAEKEIAAGQNVQQVYEAALRQSIQTLKEKLAQASQARDRAAEQSQECQLALTAQTTEQAAAEANRQRLTKESGRLKDRAERAKAQKTELLQKLAQTETEQTQAEENRQSVLQNARENKGALEQLETQKNALQAELTAYQTEREQLTQAIADSKEKRYRAAAQAERLEAEFETLQNKMWDEYEMTYSMAKKNSRPIQLQKAQQRAAQIHNELRQMEYVNPGAIEEYRRVRERHDFLFGQREDLNKARQDLERMIEELTEQMQTQFLQSFEQINQNFKRIFPLLFGGGNAELILQDKNNALSCDIEIVAQPPGKKPRYITLLSGGERALTAIALLFAMLEMRATPFCILDEIEAALDEENLVLFANFMKPIPAKRSFW